MSIRRPRMVCCGTRMPLSHSLVGLESPIEAIGIRNIFREPRAAAEIARRQKQDAKVCRG